MNRDVNRDMNVEKARRSRIDIAGIEVEVFQLPSGEYVMSQTQAAGAVGRQANSFLSWMTSERPKTLLGETPTFLTTPINDNWNTIQAIPIVVATAYWHRQSTLGNEQAAGLVYACMTETLERRCDAAFGVSRSEGERENRAVAAREVWEITRNFCKTCHGAFQQTCWQNGWSVRDTHNELTKAITGMTAAEHRMLELVGDDPDVGLDHVASPELLTRIARIKLKFASLRKGNMKERIEKAVGLVK